MEAKVKKIFVSYTQKDEQWATWIAEELEKHKHKVIIQAWDFMPGDNFVKNMDKALRTSSIVVAILSKAYLKSYHCQSELTAAYAEKNKKLVLVRINDFKVRGLWAQINYIDLVNKNQETAIKLLERIFNKPERKSKGGFPGKTPDDMMPQNNLPTRNDKFTGREKLLEDIHKTLQTKDTLSLVQVHAITGMGGVGKSETAKEYAFRYGKDYSLIWWVNAETHETMDESYIAFAKKYKLGLPKDKLEKIIEDVKDWMRENDNWLFIYDNAEDEKIVNSYRPSSCRKGQHILVTSRNTQFLRYEVINIDVFTEAESCEFIEKYTKKKANEYFKELAKKMGYLPLALDQAGAYMVITQKNYKEYLDLYIQKNLKLLTKYPNDLEKETVATTWLISFEKINNPAAKQLLNLCAFFAPENIFTKWFTVKSEVLPNELNDLRKVLTDEMDYDYTIAELTNYSLVSRQKSFLSIHRLVQDVIRDNLKQEQAMWRNHCVNILNKLRYFDFSTIEYRAMFSILVPHIDSVTNGINDKDATEEVAQLYHFVGYGFKELADYPKSLKYNEKALSIRKNILDKEHPDIATTYNNIARIYDDQGDYKKALEYHEKALDIREKTLGKEHPDTSQTYNNLAEVYRTLGLYEKALEYNKKALDIREKVFGKEHPETATIYNNIGKSYRILGVYEKALEYYQKTLDIREKVLGKKHPDTAITYNNMAVVYDEQGDYEKALEYLKKALNIQEKVLGKEHPETARTYNNIGKAYYMQGDYEKALEYLEKALVILEKVLGKEHLHTAVTYNIMAGVYYAQCAYEKALYWFLQSFLVFIKILGFEHPNTENEYNNIAVAYERSGKLEPFEEWFGEKLAENIQKIRSREL